MSDESAMEKSAPMSAVTDEEILTMLRKLRKEGMTCKIELNCSNGFVARKQMKITHSAETLLSDFL